MKRMMAARELLGLVHRGPEMVFYNFGLPISVDCTIAGPYFLALEFWVLKKLL